MIQGFLSGSVVKNPPAMQEPQEMWVRSLGREDPQVGKIPWQRNGNPLQYSCLKNPMDRGAWQATVQGVAESDRTEVTVRTH